MRACADPVDRDNLQSYRNSTQDFQAAITRFAMAKAQEASERFAMEEEEGRERRRRVEAEERDKGGGEDGKE